MDTVEPRIADIRRSFSAIMSKFPTLMRPLMTERWPGRRRISARMVTDLPEPDSPMMQSTSPGINSNDTPFTAHTVSSPSKNRTCRSSTSTSGRSERAV